MLTFVSMCSWNYADFCEHAEARIPMRWPDVLIFVIICTLADTIYHF